MRILISKRNIIILSLIYLIFLAGVLIFGDKCYSNLWCRMNLNEFLNLVILASSPFIPLSLLSVLTYRMRQEIFDTWISFAKWWIPLSILLILFVPEELSGAISVPLKVPVALFCSGLFFLISLIIIFWKHASLKKHTK